MSLNKYIFAIFIVGLTVLAGCNDGDKDIVLLNQRTKDFFNFTENTQWIYDVISDSSQSSEVYTLKNKLRSSRKEGNSEFITYDLVRDNDYFINVRCESWETEYSDRISHIVSNKDQKIISTMFWSQGHRFYGEKNDEIENLENDTINGKVYEDVWQIKLNRKGDFKEIKFAKNHGLIYIAFTDGKVLALNNLKK